MIFIFFFREIRGDTMIMNEIQILGEVVAVIAGITAVLAMRDTWSNK